jgi:hypothetical protein
MRLRSLPTTTDIPAFRLQLLGLTLDRHAVLTVLLAFLVTRLLLLLLIFASSATIPMRPGPFLYADPHNIALDGLVRYDSWWYHAIVTQGYSAGNIETGEQGTVAFFPLYPLLVKLVSALTGNVFLAGVLVSNVAFLAALAYLYALARDEFDEETAGRAVFYLAAAPTAVFFSAMYTESLYILLVVATFYYARRRAWAAAALAGALAAATRNTGVLLVAVIALEGMHAQGVRWLPPTWNIATLRAHLWQQARLALQGWPALLAAGFVLVGLLSYMAYLGRTFGDPLAFIHVQATWGRDLSPGGVGQLLNRTLSDLNIGALGQGQINTVVLFDVLATLIFALLVMAVVFRLRLAYAVFTVLTFLVPLSTGTTGSMTRYILMLIPCFLLLALWGRRQWVDRLVVGVSLPLLAYFAILFSHWYFAG